MDTNIYYSRQDILNKPHFNYVDNGTDLYLHQADGNFEIYKKIYILKKDATDVTEIYVELKVYMVIVAHLRNSKTRWVNLLDAYVFYNIKDYFECLDEANKNRLF